MKSMKKILSGILSLTMMLSLPTARINVIAEDSTIVNSADQVETQDQSAEQDLQVQETTAPEAVSDEAEATEVQEKQFVGSLVADVDGKHITINSDGAFPQGVQVQVTKVNSATVIDELKEKVNDDLQENQVYAFDFDFYIGDTHNIEPSKPVEIKVEGVEVSQQTSVYHLDEQAEEVVATTSSDNQVVFQASAFSIYAIVTTPNPSPTDGKIWVNDDQDNTYTTLSDAVTAAGENGTIHISGNFGNQATYGATVNNGITLVIEENTTIDGANQAGIVLDGAKITTKQGTTLTMRNFQTALTLRNQAEINDGTYVFENIDTGFYLDNTGKINGTSKKSLSITSTARASKVGFDMKEGSEVRNATLILNGGHSDGWTYRTMNVYNSHIEVSDVWLFPHPLNLNGSYLKVSGRFGASWRGGHVLSIYEKPGVANDSEIVVEGSRVNIVNGEGLTLNKSTMTVRNSPDGGINVNYGAKLVLNNSTLNSDNVTGALVAAGYSNPSHIEISGDSVINANEQSLRGSLGADGHYYVTGGAFNIIKPLETDSEKIPTNSPAYGNERLTLVELSDASVNQLNIPYTIGESSGTYTYSVARAASDGKKNVWVPASKVTFQLNNTNAKFADDTTDKKVQSTVRGYPLSLNAKNSDVGSPIDSNGVQFLGWFYQDDAGVEHPFVFNTQVVNKDMNVYAKWDALSIIYHGLGDTNYIQNVTSNDYNILSFDKVAEKESEFNIPGKVFKYWTTIPTDSEENKVDAGTAKSFAQGETQHDYYAQYQDLEYTVKFSANGGTFGEGSIYKTRADIFTIEQDESGGEVAVLNQKAEYNQNLFELLGTLDHNTLVPDQTATKEGFLIHSNSKPAQGAPKGYWSYSATTNSKDIYFDDYTYRILWFDSTAKGRNPQITADTTYYMMWEPDPTVTDTSSITLVSDLFISDINKTSQVQTVLSNKSFPVNMNVDFVSLKEVINGLGYEDNQFIKNAVLNLKASIVEPSRVTANQTMTATLSKDGGVVKVGDVAHSSNRITVPVGFARTPRTFGELKALVNAIGTTSGNRVTRATNDTLGITLNSYSTASTEPKTMSGDLTGSLLFTVDGRNIEYNITGTQDPELEDPEARGLNARVQAAPRTDSELTADMRIENSTTHDAPYEAYPAYSISVYGDLDVTPIKQRIEDVKNNFGGNTENIRLEDVTSRFTTTLDIPEEVLYILNQTKATLSDTDLFKITETTFVEGNGTPDYVRIVMELNKQYTSFSELYDDVVNNTDDVLTIELTPLELENVAQDTVVTLKGTVGGNFSGEAISEDGSRQVFNFRWDAVQEPETKDVNNTDDDTIQASLKIKAMTQLTLDADISSKGDTEHTALYPVIQGYETEFTGHLDVSSIQDQINAYTHSHEDGKTYNVSDVDSAFYAVLQVPTANYEMENIEFTLNDTSLFEIVEPVETVDRDGNRYFTVEMRIKDEYNNATFEALKDAVTSVNSNLEVTAKGFKVKDSVNEGDKLVVKGRVQGHLIATLTNEEETPTRQMAFLWNGVQTEDGKDKDLGEGGEPSDIQFTSIVPNATALDGDILVFDDTEHDAVYKVGKHEDMNFVGTLNVTPIQQAIGLLAQQYGGNEEDIKLNETNSQFIAKITFDPTYVIPNNIVGSMNDESLFEVTSTEVNDHTVTVTIDLKDEYKVENYKFSDLKNAVQGNQDVLKITLKGITLGDNALIGNQYKAIGEVTGMLTSIASGGAKTQKYAYNWKAVQSADGKDATLGAEDNQISFTAEVIDRSMEELPADIRIGDDTAKDHYYSVKPNQLLDYIGWLSVEPIKQKINTMVENGVAGNSLENVTFSDIKSAFVATITFPMGLEIPANVEATLSDTSMFEIVDTTVNGRSVKVRMELKNSYENLRELKDALDAHPDFLEVTVKAIKVNSAAPNYVLYTAVGEVMGTLDSNATLTERTREYHFGWIGKQTEDGKDYSQSDLSKIAFTVIVNNPQPQTPPMITPTTNKPVKAVPKTGIN